MSALSRQLASLHGDLALEHRWLCHPDRECEDGCDATPLPDRLRVYRAHREPGCGCGIAGGSDCELHGPRE